MFCAIIGDIKESRTIKKRSELQKKLNDVLGQINEVFADEIKSPFQITLGDEFQGLLIRPDSVLEIIDSIKIQIFPYAMRFGIGLGEMHTEVLEMTSLGSDGPAYYAARDAVDRLKKIQRQYGQIKSDICLISYNKEIPCLEVINALLALCYQLESSWSEKQREVIVKMVLHDYTQYEVAEQVGVNPSTVNRRLSASGYIYFRTARESIKAALHEIWENMTT